MGTVDLEAKTIMIIINFTVSIHAKFISYINIFRVQALVMHNLDRMISARSQKWSQGLTLIISDIYLILSF